jgi:oligosaccharide translocation protein RFT1
MATLGSLSDLGSYTLASNYGGLIARMLFQPIEESTRNLFAQLCSSSESTSVQKESKSGIQEARSLLVFILRLYSIIGAVAFSIGPALAPVLLRLVAGNKWADTEASTVLAVYCYYIPLLAVNGVTEGFVASVASETELVTQSMFMGVCFAIFASLAYTLVKTLGLGAVGLVYANSVNMLLRIAFNQWFNGRFFRKNGEVSTRPRRPSCMLI